MALETQLNRPVMGPCEEEEKRLRVLFCVNWAVDRLSVADSSRFSPGYIIPDQPYWFFKHMRHNIDVDVLDCRSFLGLERIERRWLHCYAFKGLLAWVRSRRYDVILSHGGQMGLVIGLLQSLFPNAAHPPHVMFDVGSISGGEKGTRNRLVYAGCRFATRSLSAAICHSSGQLEFYLNKYPDVAKIAHFIPLGVDTDEFKPEPCPQEDEIICVGYSELRIDQLVQAYAHLDTKTRLVILGVPSDHNIQHPGVVCVPHVNIDEMRRRIRRARFVVLPLPDLGFCIGQQRFLQSMAMGKAVLLPGIPTVVDYIRDGETGFLYDVDSEQDLGDKLRTLLSSDESVRRVGRAARAAIESEFSEAIMADRVAGLLHKLVRNSSTPFSGR